MLRPWCWRACRRPPAVYASSPALAHKRARVVLQRMVDCHKLTQDAAAQLSAETDVIPFITRSIA